MQRSYRSQVNHGESGNSAFVENSARGNNHLPEAQTLTNYEESGEVQDRANTLAILESNKCGGQPRHNLPNS